MSPIVREKPVGNGPTPSPVRPPLPVFVTVKADAVLVVPVAQLPNARDVGDTVAVATAPAPVPLSVTGELATPTLAAIVTVRSPLRAQSA